MTRKPRYKRFELKAAALGQAQPRAQSRSATARRVFVLAVVMGGLGLLARWFTGDAWRIRAVYVRNNGGVPMEAIIAASGLYNQHFLLHDAQRAAAAIEALNGVEAARVVCGWNGQAWCEVHITPSAPLALWEGQRLRVWNDAHGYVQVAEGEISASVRVRADDAAIPAPGTQLPPALLRALQELVEVQPEVSTYEYSPLFGIIWTPDGMQRVRLGVAEYEGAMRNKLRMARKMLQHVRARGVRPLVIDVRFPEAPYYIP